MAAPTEKEMNDALEKIRGDISSLTDSVKGLMADSDGIKSALKNKANAAAREAANVGERVLNEATEFGAEALDAAHRHATEAVNSVEGQIRRNPMAAVLIAAGVGFAFALLSRK